jgi:RNA-directed DNA polymerase
VPSRSCHDAKEAIFTAIKGKPKFVFDADIKGAFDHIKQEALLEKLHTYPTLRKAVKGWLKAGVMEGCTFSPTEAGTPQGGVISPLLMNVALHGMEALLSAGYSKSHMVEKPRLIRYADDFVIVHSQVEELQNVSEKVTRWLGDLGLTLSPEEDADYPYPDSLSGTRRVRFLGVHFPSSGGGQNPNGQNPSREATRVQNLHQTK